MFSYLTFSHHSDQEIIQHLLQGGNIRRKGEDELFSRFAYYIREGIEKYHLREDEVFDAYSDSILSAVETITRGQFERRSSLKTYLYKIFHNKCVDILRKTTTNKSSVYRTSEITGMLLHMSDTAKSIVQQLIERSDYEDLKKKMNEIGETCRSLLMLFADGYSDKEIAVSMEYKSADVVKTSRLRCLDKLRTMYPLLKKP
jgi:RNA polymerase sigma-70 factor (ECF subfamily)